MWNVSLSTCHDLHLRSSSISTWTFFCFNLILDLIILFLVPPENNNVWFIPSISNTFPRTVECIADNGVLPASNRIFTINVECKTKQFFYSKKKTCFLGILDPPMVLVKNDLIQSEQYQNVTLECHALSRPFARISWEKNGQMIEENRMTSTRVNQTMSTSRLTIQVCRWHRFYSKSNGAVFIFNRWTIVMILDNTNVLQKTFMVEWKRLSSFFVCHWISKRSKSNQKLLFLFVVEESVASTTSVKTHRYTKHHSSRMHSNRSLISTRQTNTFFY